MKKALLISLGVSVALFGNAQELGLKTNNATQVSMEAHQSVVKQNAELQRELDYQQHRAEILGGADLLMTQAKYHLERGEDVTASEKLELITTHYEGSPYAEEAKTLAEDKDDGENEPISLPAINENFEIVKDGKNGVTWYYDSRIPRGPETTSFYLYMGHSAVGSAWLRLHAQYVGTHWIHLKEIQLRSDKLIYNMVPDPLLISNASGELFCAEWNDMPPSYNDLNTISAIMSAPTAQVTFVGDKDKYTREITENERLAYIDMMELYNYMVMAESKEQLKR